MSKFTSDESGQQLRAIHCQKEYTGMDGRAPSGWASVAQAFCGRCCCCLCTWRFQGWVVFFFSVFKYIVEWEKGSCFHFFLTQCIMKQWRDNALKRRGKRFLPKKTFCGYRATSVSIRCLLPTVKGQPKVNSWGKKSIVSKVCSRQFCVSLN